MVVTCLHGGARKRAGFTLIELLVVLAIIAMLAALVAPHYFKSIDRARETSLRTSLATLRDAVDKFSGDLDRYPASLDELVQRHYVREIPVDPMTGRRDTWIVVAPAADSKVADDATDAIFDIRSGAKGTGQDGQPYEAY